MFSNIDNKKADLARYVQEYLCLPSDRDLADAIEKGGIQECGIDRRHIKIANIIYGPAKAAIEGKTVQRKNKIPRDTSMMLGIPPSTIERYGYASLGIDVLHINKRSYVIAVSKHIKYIQCLGTQNKNVDTFLSNIKRFKSDYIIQGFVVKTIYANRAFESCKTCLSEQGITLVCCDTNSHVPFIERTIRFVKERVRCVQSMLSKRIKRIPARLMRELVMATVKMINSIRRKGGVHPVISPNQSITGMRMKLPPYPPGSCVYAVPGITTNSLDNMRSFAGFYLRPNDKGSGHFVYNIDTMQRCSVGRVIGINK